MHKRLVEIDRTDEPRGLCFNSESQLAQREQHKRKNQRDRHQPDGDRQLQQPMVDIAEQRGQANQDSQRMN